MEREVQNGRVTIQQAIDKEKPKEVWLCPHEHSSQTITPLLWEYGMFYTNMKVIPKEILSCKCIKAFWENIDGKKYDTLCLIWKNFRCKGDKNDYKGFYFNRGD
jgi:hypothetical protein